MTVVTLPKIIKSLSETIEAKKQYLPTAQKEYLEEEDKVVKAGLYMRMRMLELNIDELEKILNDLKQV